VTGAAESQAWREWQRERTIAIFEAVSAKEDARGQAEEDAVQAQREAKQRDPDAQAFVDAMTGKPPHTHAAVMCELASLPDRPWCDPSAELGSEQNPVFLDAPAWRFEPQRSRPTPQEVTVARARLLADDPLHVGAAAPVP
jgi:hypothetical protein